MIKQKLQKKPTPQKMHANTWANQSPGKNPKEKGTNKAHKEGQPNRIEKARRLCSQYHYSRSRSGVLSLSPKIVRTLIKEKLNQLTPHPRENLKKIKSEHIRTLSKFNMQKLCLMTLPHQAKAHQSKIQKPKT